ncbi:putative phosphoesterase [Stackebrandtia albiflava]|uniref:Putative phosphoesterase n=1 Tax=Stackebrandtia albiflava TaxID=406432 RepID=A0A562V1W3_9ACTN|nr:metallophosphoesterase family protein [Stackebrandtia albiflava]TWJ11868.1 putative phosphoesterase [Stackebrandtia albiflava]
MWNRVAVLSDIHGVAPALDAVLAEPDVAAAERIVLTGDIIAGPQAAEVFDTLLTLGDRVVWVRGNGDREMLAAATSGEPPKIPVDPWAYRRLTPEHLELLRTMPTEARLSVAGVGEVLFCHATPRNDTEVALVDSRPDRWGEVLSTLDPAIDAVVCGHTHMPFVRLTHGILVVNPGSVGMPYGRPGAHWGMLGPGVTLRRTEFDYDAACRRIAESGYPGGAAWADEYVRARNSDLDALAVFGPMDGRDA